VTQKKNERSIFQRQAAMAEARAITVTVRLREVLIPKHVAQASKRQSSVRKEADGSKAEARMACLAMHPMPCRKLSPANLLQELLHAKKARLSTWGQKPADKDKPKRKLRAVAMVVKPQESEQAAAQ
jgi:hypothetical protein